MNDEVRELDKAAKHVIFYLVAAFLISFILGFLLLDFSGRLWTFFAVALFGFSGSAGAALTSCLDRYARGFELENGSKWPEEAKGETFNSRMARWFYVRPFLGFVVAPVFTWSIVFIVDNPETFTASPEALGFTSFLGGLLAKSVLELIKGLFKNVFKA